MLTQTKLFRYLYCQARLLVSKTARDELEEAQATFEYVQELLVREDALRALEQRDLVDLSPRVVSEPEPESDKNELITPHKTWLEESTVEGEGIDVVEYDPDALDYLIQHEGEELHQMLKKEGWA